MDAYAAGSPEAIRYRVTLTQSDDYLQIEVQILPGETAVQPLILQEGDSDTFPKLAEYLAALTQTYRHRRDRLNFFDHDKVYYYRPAHLTRWFETAGTDLAMNLFGDVMEAERDATHAVAAEQLES